MSPQLSLEVLERYAFVILPALTVAEQVGLPLPAVPALLAVGALAAHGGICIPLVLGAMSVAALAIDFTWYELGRRRGAQVLVALCRLSLEPVTCARRAEDIFARHGARSMLAVKFVPGLTTIMPPLAGVFAVKRVRFALYDLAGVLLWAGTWLAVGYVFSDAIALITARVTALEHMLGIVIVAMLAGYIVLRYGRRQLLQRRLQTARMSLDVLKRPLDAGEDVTRRDPRTPLDGGQSSDRKAGRDCEFADHDEVVTAFSSNRAKVEGKELELQAEERPRPVGNLMKALEQSLAREELANAAGRAAKGPQKRRAGKRAA